MFCYSRKYSRGVQRIELLPDLAPRLIYYIIAFERVNTEYDGKTRENKTSTKKMKIPLERKCLV